MGVPGFFGWLVQHCRTALVPAKQPGSRVGAEESKEGDDAKLSRTQMDCLYLDMNGIIHPCCHPEGAAPLTEEEMMQRICLKVDEIVNLVRPTTLLYLAIDGTAPRAKMNQQRTRRFRGQQLREVEQEIIAQLKQEWRDCKIEPPGDDLLEPWDSNVITPGTPFMEKVAQTLEYYVTLRLEKDPKWAGLTVVVSGSNEPGEGEHKIIQFIKKQRLQPGYRPNTTHCIVGEDADLIMLAMSVHSPHMYILRTARPPKGKERKGPAAPAAQYNYLVVSVVVGYFERCFQPILQDETIPDSGRLLTRMLDDLTLVFCLVGNDFLPHVPGLKIQHNALGVALLAYIECFKNFNGGYLTDCGDVDFERLAVLLERLKQNFRTVSDSATQKALEEGMKGQDVPQPPTLAEVLSMGPEERVAAFTQQVRWHLAMQIDRDIAEDKTNDKVLVGTDGWERRHYSLNFARELDEMAKAKGHDTPTETDLEDLQRKVSFEYLRGLSWVVAYYFQECPSWQWFYPFHYAPVLRTVDIGAMVTHLAQHRKADASRVKSNSVVSPARGGGPGGPSGSAFAGILYEASKPYTPFEQLTAVLPPATAEKVLPAGFVKCMTKESSVLKRFYPKTFAVDLRDCPPPWHCTVLLPFIDDAVFLPVLRKLQAAITDADTRRRNAKTNAALFVGPAHPLHPRVAAFVKGVKGGAVAPKVDSHRRQKDSPCPSGRLLDMAEGAPLAGELIPGTAAWERKGLRAGGRLATVFGPDRQEAFPSLEKSGVARCLVQWPEARNVSEVLPGTDEPDHSARLKPSAKVRKPSHSFHSRTTREALPIVLQPGRELDKLQAFWAGEVLPCWYYSQFGWCRYEDKCHYAHGDDSAAAPAAAPAAAVVATAEVEVEMEVAAEAAAPAAAAPAAKIGAKRSREVAGAAAEEAAAADHTKLYVTAGAGVARDALKAYIEARTGVAPLLVKWKMPGGKKSGVMVVRFASDAEGAKVASAVEGATLPGGSAPLKFRKVAHKPVVAPPAAQPEAEVEPEPEPEPEVEPEAEPEPEPEAEGSNGGSGAEAAAEAPPARKRRRSVKVVAKAKGKVKKRSVKKVKAKK